jgi:hypothetical protein
MSRHCQVDQCLQRVEATLHVELKRRLEETVQGHPVTGFAGLQVLTCGRHAEQIVEMFGGPCKCEVQSEFSRTRPWALPDGDTGS